MAGGADNRVGARRELTMATELKTLRDAFVDELRDAYDFEQQLLIALPTVAAAAEHRDLRSALEDHLIETRAQVERLTTVFGLLGETPQRKHCVGMAGILDEGGEVVEDDSYAPQTKDACLIAGCQRVEHYEIAVYGTLVAWAQMLDLNEVEGLLQHTLDEEEAADAALSELAEIEINAEAIHG
jgi:ferritin-like metal-binding protein YciE